MHQYLPFQRRVYPGLALRSSTKLRCMRQFSPFGLLHRLVVLHSVLVGDFYFMIRVYFMFKKKKYVAIIEGTLPCSVPRIRTTTILVHSKGYALLTEINLLLL